ncbi:MAG: efflux RND transporter periplasmic adaptor subunit [Pseudomonadota bacterium]
MTRLLEMRRANVLMILVLVMLSAVLAGCGGANGQEAVSEEDEEAAVAVPVEVAAIERSTVFAAYEGTSTLEAEQEADVVAKAGGVILELLVDEGDRVEAGQVVARIDRDRLEIQLKQAKAVLGKLESEFERLDELSEKKLISRDAFDKVKFDLEQQRASVELAELELSYTEVRSPIGGVISERLVKVGNLVELFSPLFRVDDFDPLLAVMYVPERELSTLALGQEARLNFDAVGDDYFMGRLERISPVVDPRTGTFKVTVEVDDPDPRLKPGIFGRVRIVHDVHADALTVPREALIIEDRGAYVYVADGDKARKVDLVTGYTTAGRVEVLQGLEDGEYVVTSGKGSIGDGTLIEVINSEAVSLAAGDATATTL